ncbi:CaiB/BaiF CoA transferase family protein [Phreatobacter stygius]|nr:CoA transferase [Phreatobacter stygius]
MPPETALPLAGIRVVDLGWITAGAGTSALLLDLGAEVTKVEGPGAVDPFRLWDEPGPDTDWWNRSPFFAFTNRGKRSLCLDLKDPDGQQALFRLLEQADVLVENYRRGVLVQLGLDAAGLRRRFPRLVIASISSQGEDGPERDMISFGSTLEATAGLAALTGAGQAPVVTGRDMNYPDQVVCLFAAGAIVAALIERDRTGQGSHLDLSQRELTTFLIGEELIAAAAGAASPRFGNANPAEPAERLVRDTQGWQAEWPGGQAPVRDGRALVASSEFGRGTAMLHDPDGRPVKGIPFRLANRRLSVKGACHKLGADNRAVLAEAGLTDRHITMLEDKGALATAPRRIAAR